jgi:hypothetical protein
LTKEINSGYIYVIGMAEKNNQNDILSSWKEIAAYLSSGVRTCMRWEKEDALPVHRLEGKTKSSVIAYKNELDAWLEKKLSANAKLKKERRHVSLIRKSLYVLLPLIAVFIIYFLLSGHIPIKKKPSPEKQTAASGVPQSTGPLTLKDNDIVTTEYGPGGKLRVWRKNSENAYQEVWRIEPVYHSSLAVGNVDDKNDCEIVAPGVCREVLDRGDRKEFTFRYFLNIYKQGEKDWWKTTFYSKEDCVYEEKVFELTETAVGNVDGIPGNEVVLITRHNLGIFKYVSDEKEFRLLRSRDSFFEDKKLLLTSVALGDIDGDDIEEILITADEWVENETPENVGWLLILKMQDEWPQIVKSVEIDANPAFQSLRLGDVIKGGEREIIFPAYRKINGLDNSYILGWDTSGRKIIDKQFYDHGQYTFRRLHLDVKDIMPYDGDEIIVGHHDPQELVYFYWDGTKLAEGSRFPLSANSSLTNVFVSSVNPKGDSPNEIIACGACRTHDQPGMFYIELIGFNGDFFSEWKRLGGEKEEIGIAYAAFGKKKE